MEDLFYQYVRYLEAQGETDHETVFIDGTKLESRAGRYTFVWRKSVEKLLAKVKQKVYAATSQTNLEGLEQQLSEKAAAISFVYGAGHRKSEAQKSWEALDELRQKSPGKSRRRRIQAALSPLLREDGLPCAPEYF